MSVPILLNSHSNPLLINGNLLEIKPLGAGREVGRSCFILKYMGHTVMLDCGVHPAKEHGEASLPLFEYCDLNSVELLCITHFHVDHCAALPYVVLERKYKGKILMTPPTKEIFGELFKEFHQMSTTIQPYKPVDSKEVLDKIETIKFHELKEVNGIKVWCYNAGHVLGAAMFLIEIAGVRVLYSGDFSGETDRHLQSAEIPPIEIDVMICESTYGIMDQESRSDREIKFVKQIVEILKRGGKCLIPVFSLGRAQEFELILEDYWSKHKDLWSYRIFFFSSIAKKCITYFEKFTSFMNQDLRKNINQSFKFKFISEGSSTIDESSIDEHPCVVLASPGMLQDGVSRTIFERWCTDKNNGLIIPGYCVEGTLAKQLITDSSKPFISSKGETLTPKCSVSEISFCAHSDYLHTKNFIGAVKPKHLVLIHGESKSMEQLHNALKKIYPDLNIYMPVVTQPIQIPIQSKHEVKLLGTIATGVINQLEMNNKNEEKQNNEELILHGVFLQNTKDVHNVIVEPKDVERFSSLHSNKIIQQLVFSCFIPFVDVYNILLEFYNDIELNKDNNSATLRGIVLEKKNNEIFIRWENDINTELFVNHIIMLLLEMGISDNNTIRKIPDIDQVSIDSILKIFSSKFESVMILKNNDDILKYKKELILKSKEDKEQKELEDKEQKELEDKEQKELKEDKEQKETNELKEDNQLKKENTVNDNKDVGKNQNNFENQIEVEKVNIIESNNDNSTYFLIKNKDEFMLLQYPSMQKYGGNEEMISLCNMITSRLSLIIDNKF